LKQKGNDKSRNLELHWEERKNTERSKNIGKYTVDFPSLLDFSKLCWPLETKIITLSDMVLNVSKGDI